MARKWAEQDSPAIRESLTKALQDLEEIERFFAYPGQALLENLKHWLTENDAKNFLRLSQRISGTIVSKKYHRDVHTWNLDDQEDGVINHLSHVLTHQ